MRNQPAKRRTRSPQAAPRAESRAMTRRDSEPVATLATVLRQNYGRKVSPVTLEKRIQRGIAPKPSLPILPSVERCHYIVDRLSKPGPGGTDEILTVLFALGLGYQYPYALIRKDLDRFVVNSMRRMFFRPGMSEVDKAIQISDTAERISTRPKLKSQTDVNAAIRRASKSVGSDRIEQKQDVYDIQRSSIEFRYGNQDALGVLVEDLSRLFPSDLTEHDKELIRSRFTMQRFRDTVARIPLDQLYELIRNEYPQSLKFGQSLGIEWLVSGPEAVKTVVFHAIARYVVYGPDLPKVVDSEIA